MSPRFVDTNILLRYFTRDDEAKARQPLSLLTCVEDGEETVVTSVLVIFETVFSLERSYKVPKAKIVSLLSPILHLPDFQLADMELMLRALLLY